MDTTRWSAAAGHLFRMGLDQRISTVRWDVICSNGCGWSPDGLTMYHVESFRYAVCAYDFERETGALSNRRVFVSIDPDGGGFPDGMTVDADGFVWCCLVGLGQIRRYDPSGALERIVQLPVPRATDCTFGGASLRTLFVTSARETMSPEQLAAAPLSGSLFAYESPVVGLRANAFRG